MEIKNRKAQHEFLFKQSFEAGIILDGAEVKSIREGNANINDAFCYFRDNELFIRNFHVAPFKQAAAWATHDSLRRESYY